MKRSKSLCTINLVSYPSQFLPTNSGEQANIKTLGTHKPQVNSVAFSPDGRIIVSSGDDQLVNLWDVDTGNSIHRFTPEGGKCIDRVVFFPNQYNFATDAYFSHVSLWKITTEGEILGQVIDQK